MLIARIYEVFPLVCPLCAGQMRIIAFIVDGAHQLVWDREASVALVPCRACARRAQRLDPLNSGFSAT